MFLLRCTNYGIKITNNLKSKKMYNIDKINNELKKYQNSKYYGQWETDKEIEFYFDINKKGICIEVGAANGIKGSNTKYFEENNWDVLCLEANPNCEKDLKKTRKHFLMCGCGKENKQEELTIYKVGQNNIESSITSLIPDERLINDHKHIINSVEKVKVQVYTLNWILDNLCHNTPFENIKNIDFISIDTEGTELDVLQGIDFNKYRIKLLIVENNYEDEKISIFLKQNGFKLDKRYKINDFYLNTNL